MPGKLRKQAKLTKEAKEEVKMLTSRLLEITVKMDEYIYYKKMISSREAKSYLQELNIYEKHFTLDVRSKQVVEKLVNFMKLIVEEEVDELRANGTLGNIQTAALQAPNCHENSIQNFLFSGNRLTSPFDINNLDGPIAYERNMNPSVDVDINGNEKNFSQPNDSQEMQLSDSININNDQVSVLSRSVLQDHNYTSWEGPKHNFDDDTTHRTKRNKFVAPSKKPRYLVERNATERNMMAMPVHKAAVAKKYILVKIPGNRSKTPSPAKYIKINPSPRRDLNVPPIYAKIPNGSAKRVLFRNVNSCLPANYLKEKSVVQMAPKNTAVPIAAIATENNAREINSNKQKNKRNTTCKLKSDNDDENFLNRSNKRGKINTSQETILSLNASACRKKKKPKNKLKPNEEDLSWVENLKFVRVFENDEVCTQNMTLTDAFWRNLEYPPDWDDGVYLM